MALIQQAIAQVRSQEPRAPGDENGPGGFWDGERGLHRVFLTDHVFASNGGGQFALQGLGPVNGRVGLKDAATCGRTHGAGLLI